MTFNSNKTFFAQVFVFVVAAAKANFCFQFVTGEHNDSAIKFFASTDGWKISIRVKIAPKLSWLDLIPDERKAAIPTFSNVENS